MARGGFAEIFGGDDFEFVRQQPLLDEQNGVARAIKSDGAKMLGAAADGDVHVEINRNVRKEHEIQPALIFIRRILLWISSVNRLLAEFFQVRDPWPAR